MIETVNPVEPAKKRRIAVPRVLAGIIVAVVIFSLGVGVGDGRLRVGQVRSIQKNAPAKLDYSSVEQVYEKIRTDYDGQLDQTKLLDGLKEGLAQATGDPYTEYFNPQEAKDFNNELDGTFSGIGAELSKDANGNIIVISPLAGYPAEKAGLKAKDVIEAVNGKNASGQSVDDTVTQIRGAAGTTVTLKILRDGNQEQTLTITREQIQIPSVDSQILTGNIGYMKISRFGDDTTELAQQAAQKFKQAGVKGVILDLRGDPGGLLTAAVNVSSIWLNSGQTVLQEKRNNVVVQTYTATGSPILNGVPTVVLIDEGSASASEITSGALHDNKAATLIGVKSFGKGSVQQIENLGDGSMVKVTIAHWFTPDGKSIDKQGITPDQTVMLSDDDAKNQRDPQKDAAINFLTK